MLNNTRVCKELVEEFEWLEKDLIGSYVIDKYGYRILDMYNLDVNFEEWHNSNLTGHPVFKFKENKGEIKKEVRLDKNNYEQFKQVLRDYEAKYYQNKK